VQQRGVVGGVTGIAKGLAGTFTKPIAGMFDFSREIALSLRDKVSQTQRVNGVIKPIRNVRVTTSMNKALQPWNFYESLALQIFELELTKENHAKSASGNNNQETTTSTSSSASSESSSTSPRLTHHEVFYLGRMWQFRNSNEPATAPLHHVYITSKRVVFFISTETTYQISYQFVFRDIKSCNNRDGRCVVVKKNAGRNEESFTFSCQQDPVKCAQLVFLINKAKSLWYETTHYLQDS
jgi:hypothetical protein